MTRHVNCPICGEMTVATNRNGSMWICPNNHQFATVPTSKVTDEKFNPTGSTEVHSLKAAALEYQRIIMINAPEGRERSVALTHLKTCSMWAVSSLFPTGDAE